MTSAQTQQQVDLALWGRQAKAHLDMAAKHKEKYWNNGKSAGLLLIQAKAKLKHGQWEPYLEKHDIPKSTANLWIARVNDPAQIEAKQAYDRQYQEEKRAQTTTTRGHFTPPPQQPKAASPEPEQPPRKHYEERAQVVPIVIKRITTQLPRLTEAQLVEVEQFIKSLLEAVK